MAMARRAAGLLGASFGAGARTLRAGDVFAIGDLALDAFSGLFERDLQIDAEILAGVVGFLDAASKHIAEATATWRIEAKNVAGF
jgi:hypothetical protein